MKPFFLLLLTSLMAYVVFSQNSNDENQVRACIQKAEDAYITHDYSYEGKYDIFNKENQTRFLYKAMLC
jgi:hypothetical protein